MRDRPSPRFITTTESEPTGDDIDATEILPGVSEVLCYGTAMRVSPRERAGGWRRGTSFLIGASVRR